MTPEPVLAQAIWRAIATHPNRKVPLQVLQKAAAAVDNTGATSVGWRERILTAIRHLQADGRITLPKTRMDTTAIPALPLYVSRPIVRPGKNVRTPPPVWHAELAWAAALFDQGLLTGADQRFLTGINVWLSKRRGTKIPLRERSLEIFGDEKLLETRISSSLFSHGRLTLDLLQTYLCWPPVERLNSGPGDWLIVENYTTYHSLTQRARELGFDGQIIWGSGNGVTTRLAALASEPARPPRLYYFGDIDAGGFRIARSAAARADMLDMPKLTAAQGLYTLTQTHGTPRSDTNARAPDQAALSWTREWLGEPLATVVTDLLAARKRIVQETVGKELLASTALADWF
ncbi:Wadjet anti-phage system protein JetD domain-containing protein [Mycobacterium avium]|uniref:Wadjet anti-phage system protein JetD domain-containing protein n=1 Tax=Mycobacterium avium TaxID=1764 RepID=UPI0009C13581|nr:Wadjet anti-phage system protein JetD domain-containing protein [Mycobacterium avium]